MPYIVKTIITALIAIFMQTSVINTATTTPAEAADVFLKALKAQDSKEMERYMDNAYVNFLCNAEGDEKMLGKMSDAIFDNFEYEIEIVKQKNKSAVAKVMIKSNDFSKVMDKYKKESYDYIMENLYEKEIGDKEALNAKCLELYVAEIEKAAESDKRIEREVFVPMTDNGYYGWNIIVTDEFMESVLGGLEVPEN
ncbi:MAG: hypothetical protein IJA50_04725 [Firmicutes bacterium]|nr:hypothetical protein [Bacillota bacterium]